MSEMGMSEGNRIYIQCALTRFLSDFIKIGRNCKEKIEGLKEMREDKA